MKHKSFNRFLALLLSCSMAAALAACGSSGSDSGSSSDSSDSAETAVEATQEEEESAEDETEDEEVETASGVPDVDDDRNDDYSVTLVAGADLDSDYVADEVTVALSEVYSSIYPFGSTAGAECNVEIYEKLYGWVRGMTADDIYPILVDPSKGEYGGYDHEEGTSEYTFYLYDYIYDHAGNHITAYDVQFSYDTNNAEGGLNVATYESIEVVDDYTFTFHFSRELTGVGELASALTNCNIVSETAYNESSTGLVTEAIGTGPYYLESFSNGTEITVVAYDDYWQTDESLRGIMAQANVTTINYVVVSETAQKVIALENDTIDIAPSLGYSSVGDFIDGGSYSDEYNLATWRQTGTKLLYYNFLSETMQDVNLRTAIGYAIDVAGITQSLGEGEAIANYSLIPSVYTQYNSAWADEDNYNAVYSLEKAQEYLDASDYNGETLTLITESTYSSECEVIMQMLSLVGINCEITTLDKATLTSVRLTEDWDINIDQKAGGQLTQYMQNAWSTTNTTNGTYDNFIDDEWQGMLENYLTLDGNTQENLEEWIDWAYDNAVGMALYSSINYNVYKSWILTSVQNTQNKIIPGAMKYAEH